MEAERELKQLGAAEEKGAVWAECEIRSKWRLLTDPTFYLTRSANKTFSAQGPSWAPRTTPIPDQLLLGPRGRPMR
jgi:hypothetical protein